MTPEERRRLTVENRDNIEENKRNIVTNRRLLIGLNIVMLIVIALAAYNGRHNIHDCEERLFEKLTNMKHPKGISK